MLYFTNSEFKCRCGCGMDIKDMDQTLTEKLDLARSIAKVPFNITSAIRCDKHNEAVGGLLVNSSHLKGYAVDIEATSSRARYKIVYGLIKAGFNRIGIYKTFIHVDNDPLKAEGVMWNGK